jgi:hypothetical protein
LRKADPTVTFSWSTYCLFALATIFLIGVFSTELADPDAWWHLATGRYIVTHRRLPVPDPFSYTSAIVPPANSAEASTERFNLTHEWLAQVVWYGVEAGGGFGAVVLWKALLLTVLCATTGWVAWRRTGSTLWGVGAALAVSSLAIEFAHDRPSILTYVFTALFVGIFEQRGRLWLLPPLAIVWANCHGGFFLGWIVCFAYAAEAVLRRLPDRRRILIISGLTVLASGINPNGFGAIATVVRYRESSLQATLIEWSRADLWGPPYVFDVLLYSAALCLALSWRRVRIADWILFGAFGAAALLAFRNELLIGLLAPVLIAEYFPFARFRVPVRLVEYAGIACLALVVVWGAARGSFFQLRAAEWRYPRGAATFLRERVPDARIFNTYEYGGYLIWRGIPVFIDGRALREAVFADYRKILGTPAGDPLRKEALARYGVNAIVVNSFEYNAGALYAIVPALAQPAESEWKLVYDDPEALVFVREPAPGVPVLDKSRIVDHLEAECQLHVERDPAFSLCARTLGDLFLRSGDRLRARRALGLYLQHPYAEDPEARRAYQQLLQQ